MVTPVCECHREPMSRYGRSRSGKQRYICRVKNRERQRRVYHETPFGEFHRAKERGDYHDPGKSDRVLRKLMRQQTRYRQSRLAQLTGGTSA